MVTTIEAGRIVEDGQVGTGAPSPTCECLHVGSAGEGWSGHEFVALAETATACERLASWQGYRDCDADHLRVTSICAECRQAHVADAASGGVQVDWLALDA